MRLAVRCGRTFRNGRCGSHRAHYSSNWVTDYYKSFPKTVRGFVVSAAGCLRERPRGRDHVSYSC
jgi:hypothetical protein